MTGRERLRAILRKQPKDRLAWTTLVDNNTLALLPEHLRGNGGIDFYRFLGCDIFLLNGWNTPHDLRSPVHQWPESVAVSYEQEGARVTTRWRTPHGELTGITQNGHPIKYPVDSIDAVRIYTAMWEGVTFHPYHDHPALAALDELIGEYGVVTRFWGPSTIPRLLEQDMGTQHFYYLLADHPGDMRALVRTMHERELEAFKLLAEGPWESVTLVENTSTFYISPAVYREFNMPHQRDFVETVKATGKTALLHMCGHVHRILDLIRQTGCDGIHALTPPPTGDTPWEDALDVLGDDTIIFGALDPTIFVAGDVEEIAPSLNRLITPRLREANFVLCPFADGIPVPMEQFLAVREWVGR